MVKTVSRTRLASYMSAAASTASRLSRLNATCAAMSPSCWGVPSGPIAVCPEQYNVRVWPVTTSPWLNPISTDHVTGLTATRSIATSAPIRFHRELPAFASPRFGAA